MIRRQVAAAVAAAAVAGCGSTAAPRAPLLPRYDTARAAFSCTVSDAGMRLAIRVPGEGHRARVTDLIVRVNYPGGTGRTDKVIGVPHGVVPAGGMVIRWQAGASAMPMGDRCRVTGSLG